jgi:hypothetical protein
MGVEGSPERQREELLELRQTLPMLKALVYFNAPDVPGAIRHIYPTGGSRRRRST